MQREICLIIGNVRDGECEGLLQPGFDVFLLRDKKSVSKITHAGHVRVIAEYDFSLGYSDTLHELITSLLRTHRIGSVLNFRESYVEITATICSRHPQLAHLQRNIERTLDKSLQRQLFAQNGNPDLQVYSALIEHEQLRSGATGIDFPYVLKPINLYSSLFVKCIHNQQDLDDYLAHEWPALNRYVAGKTRESNQLLIEEYLHGSNHSIDCAIDANGGIHCFPIVDVITGMEIGRQDFHHFARYAPSVIEADMAERCRRLAEDAVRSLDLRATFAHVEFILTARGPRILEIAARPGGNRIHVLRQAYGLDLDLAYHQALSGAAVPVATRLKTAFGIVTPFARQVREYRGFLCASQVSQLATFKQWYSFVQEGEKIGPVGDGFQNYLYIELHADSQHALRASMQEISQMDVFGEDKTMKSILIIAGRDSSINWPGAEDYHITFFQSLDNVTPVQMQKTNRLCIVDFSDEAAIIQLAQDLHEKQPFAAVASFSEQTLLLASVIGEKLGVVHNPVDSVLKTRNKEMFRKAMAGSAYALPACAFEEIADVAPFLEEHGKIIIKPMFGSGSHGVYELKRGDDLSALHISGPYVAELYAEGEEFSVESLSLDGAHRILGVTRKFTTGAPNYVETGHNFPAGLDQATQERIQSAVSEMLNIIGHRWGPAHTEVKIDGERLHFIETQTRFGGDQIWEMVWKVTGTHLVKATMDGMTGKAARPDAPLYTEMAIRFFDVNRPGFDMQTLANRVKGQGVIRVQLENARFNRPLRCSFDRHGYALLGRDATLNTDTFQQTISRIETL